MSAGGSFGGARGYQPRPPEKGVFPLDHFGECKGVQEAYMKCLKENSGRTEACREVAKTYLECRMSRNLMAEQSLEELGFGEGHAPAVPLQPREESRSKERTGFVAGLGSLKTAHTRREDNKKPKE
jgi:cytochrome c oxidase assembly protein subunit 19